MTRSLDRNGKSALVLCARSGLTTGSNFAIFADEAAQQFHIFVVDYCGMVSAKEADSGWCVKAPRRCLNFFGCGLVCAHS